MITLRLSKKKRYYDPLLAKRKLRLDNYKEKLEIVQADSEILFLIKQIISYIELEFPKSTKFRKIVDLLKSQIKNDSDLAYSFQVTKYHLYSILIEIIASTYEEQYIRLDVELHPIIKKTSLSLYKDGHYSEAVFESVKALNNYVKKLANTFDKDLWNAMAKIFDEKNPILKINNLKNPSELNEQEGFKFLFMGAMKGIRNPLGHDSYDFDRNIALWYLSFLSLLFNKAENASCV